VPAGLGALRDYEVGPRSRDGARVFDALDLEDQGTPRLIDGGDVRPGVPKGEQEGVGLEAQGELHGLAGGAPGDEADAPRTLRPGPDGRQLLAQPARVAVASADQAEPPGVRDRRGQTTARDLGHRGRDYRVVETEPLRKRGFDRHR